MSSSLDLGLFIFFNFTNPALFHDFFFLGGERALWAFQSRGIGKKGRNSAEGTATTLLEAIPDGNSLLLVEDNALAGGAAGRNS